MKILLSFLLLLLALSATISGVLLVLYPDGHMLELNTDLLKNSPFPDFRIPGIVLFGAVGGISLWACIDIFTKKKPRYNIAIASGTMLLLFLLGQLVFLNSYSWLQFIYGGIGGLIILMAYQLEKKWAV